MKTKKLLLLLPALIIIILSCSKSNDSNTNNNTYPVELSKTAYSGCFINHGLGSDKNTVKNTGDSLYYTIENDTLLLHVLMRYNCCGSLKDSVVVDDDIVNIYVSDTCTDGCICYCECDFGFDYSFTNFLGNNIHFYVYLKGYEENEYSLWDDLEYIE